MALKEELDKITSIPKRKFLLLRMADIDTQVAMKLCNIAKGTYNSWCKDPDFVEIHRRREELLQDYRSEAVQMLRRETQLSAVVLEAKIIDRMKEELETGEYNLMKTGIAKEVYTKLMTDLDYRPKALALTWEQRINELASGLQPQDQQIQIVEVTDASWNNEADNSQEAEYTESDIPQESLQEVAPC